jgi:hypothetical protein
MKVYNYPKPKAPHYKKPESVEECLPMARMLVEQEHGRAALGPVKKGENILIVTLPDQDEFIKEAVTRAFQEKGANSVDFISGDMLAGERLKRYSAENGWREATMFVEGRASTSITNSDLATGILTDKLIKYLKKHSEYDSIFFDIGQRTQKKKVFGDKFKNNWILNNWEEFVSGIWIFPASLLKEIEKRTLAPLKQASAIRITDPEGTYLEYTLTEEEAERWWRTAYREGHLYLNPFQGTVKTPGGPIIPKVTGVLAGTANHTGYFPRIQLYFNEGRLIDVEGGGKYGEKIKELMEEYEDIQWPGYPDKGLFWLVDTALCTIPKAFRRTSDLFDSYLQYPNIPERNRNGIFHIGFGSASSTHTKEMMQYAEEHGIPTGHIHVHNYFVTFEVKIRGTNQWYKIVDKGRITVMDDPEIRAITSEYGNPDHLLSYEWVPPLPGINCKGDYLEDYAPDPAGYLKERMEKGEQI